MDPREELIALRRLAELEAKASQGESSFGERMGESLFAGAQKTGAGLANLPVMAGRGISWALDKAGVPNSPNSWLSQFTAPNYFDEVLSNAEQRSKEKGIQNPYGREAVESVPGAFITPGFAAASPGKAVLSSVIPAISGEAGAQAFGTGGTPNEGARLATGILTGLASGWALGPKLSVAEEDLRRQMSGMTQNDWANTYSSGAKLLRSGAKTATAADAFPEGSGVRALAQSTINREGGEALANKIGPRFAPYGDMSMLGEKFLDNLAPRVEPATAANQLSDAANAYLKTQAGLATQGVTNRLAGKTLKEADVEAIYNQLRAEMLAAAKTQPSMVPIYQEVMQSLLQAGKGPKRVITDLQGLSYQLKNLKDAPISGLDKSAATKGSNAMWSKVIGRVEDLLAQKSPDWDAAMKDYKAFMSGPMSEAKTGAIRSVSDRTPTLENPTPLSKLESFVTGYDPTTIAANAKLLENPAFTGGPTVDANVIARALAQKRLASGSKDPGQTIRGIQGSDKEQALRALAPNASVEPLEVADMLQGLSPKRSNVQPIPEMRWWQAPIRPFRTIDMMMTLSSERKIAGQIAELLKDPQNLPKLQKIAMFNPEVRKQLTLIGALRPLATNPAQPQE